MRMKRSSRVGRPVCEGRHVVVAAEVDLCGVEVVRLDSEYMWAVGYVE